MNKKQKINWTKTARITYTDPIGNFKKLDISISDEGKERVSLTNNQGILFSLFNVTFMITRDEIRAAGYERTGSAEFSSYLRKAAIRLAKENDFNATKIAAGFSKITKLDWRS